MWRAATREADAKAGGVGVHRPEECAEACAGVERLEAGRRRLVGCVSGGGGQRRVERRGLVGIGVDALGAHDRLALDGQQDLGEAKPARALDQQDLALDPVAEPHGGEIVQRQADRRRPPGFEHARAHQRGELHIGEGRQRPAMRPIAGIEVLRLDAKAVPDSARCPLGRRSGRSRRRSRMRSRAGRSPEEAQPTWTRAPP